MPSWQEMLKARRGGDDSDEEEQTVEQEVVMPAADANICSIEQVGHEKVTLAPDSQSWSTSSPEPKTKKDRRELQAKRRAARKGPPARQGSELKGKAGMSESRRGTSLVPAGQSWQDVLTNVLTKRGCHIPEKVEVPTTVKTTLPAKTVEVAPALGLNEAPKEPPALMPPQAEELGDSGSNEKVHVTASQTAVGPREVSPATELCQGPSAEASKVDAQEVIDSITQVEANVSGPDSQASLMKGSPTKGCSRLARAGIQTQEESSADTLLASDTASSNPVKGTSKSSGRERTPPNKRALRAFTQSDSSPPGDASDQKLSEEPELAPSPKDRCRIESSTSAASSSTSHAATITSTDSDDTKNCSTKLFAGRSSFGSDVSAPEVPRLSNVSFGSDKSPLAAADLDRIARDSRIRSVSDTPPTASGKNEFAWEHSPDTEFGQGLAPATKDRTAIALDVTQQMAAKGRSSFGLSAADADILMREASFGAGCDISVIGDQQSSVALSPPGPAASHCSSGSPSSPLNSSTSSRTPDPMGLTITSSAGGGKKSDLDRSFFLPVGLGIDRPEPVNKKEKAFNDLQRIEARLFASELREEELWKIVKEREEEFQADPEKRKLLAKLHELMALRKGQRTEVTPQYLQQLKNTEKASAILGSFNGVPGVMRTPQQSSANAPPRMQNSSNSSMPRDQISNTVVKDPLGKSMIEVDLDSLFASPQHTAASTCGYPKPKPEIDLDNSFFLPQRFAGDADQLSNTKRILEELKMNKTRQGS